MAFAPLEMNGVLARSQDMMSVKHNMDNKAVLQQANITQEQNKEIDQQLHQVNDMDLIEDSEDLYDPRKEGRNKYQPQAKKKKKNADGKVIVKKAGGFDIKV